MAQVRGLGPRVGGRLALFCIHRVNRVYGALVDMEMLSSGPTHENHRGHFHGHSRENAREKARGHFFYPRRHFIPAGDI